LKKKINLGLIGYGSWGYKITKTIIYSVKGANLKSIYSRKKKSFLNYPEKKITSYTNWKKMINRENLDGVIIAMPAKFNFPIVSELLKKRIPVLIEKPIATQVIEVKKILNMCSRHESIADINHIDLFNNAVKKLISVKIKKIKSIKAKISAPYIRRADITPMWEYAPHFVAVILKLTKSKLLSVSCQYAKIENGLSEKKKRNMYKIQLNFKDKLKAVILVGNGTRKKNRKIEILTSNHNKYIYNDMSKTSLIYQKSSKIKKVLCKKELPLINSIISFVKKIKKNQVNYNGIKLGLKVTQILSLAEKSLKAKRLIRFI